MHVAYEYILHIQHYDMLHSLVVSGVSITLHLHLEVTCATFPRQPQDAQTLLVRNDTGFAARTSSVKLKEHRCFGKA